VSGRRHCVHGQHPARPQARGAAREFRRGPHQVLRGRRPRLAELECRCRALHRLMKLRRARLSESFGKWLVSAPPVVYLLVFFVAPSLIMVLASFRTPGEFGGLSPLFEDGKIDLNLDSYARFFTESV